MAKIIKLKTTQDNMVESLEYILEQAKQGNIESFAFSAQLTDGNIATSYFNADVGTKQALIGHMQADVMYQIVEANVDRLIERI